jgi:hypothetical protein
VIDATFGEQEYFALTRQATLPPLGFHASCEGRHVEYSSWGGVGLGAIYASAFQTYVSHHLLKTRVDQASSLGLTRCAAYRISVGGCCQSIFVFLVQKDDQGKIKMQGFHNRKFQHHSHSI